MNIDFDKLGDSFLTQIKNYIDYEINQGVKIDSAVVSRVNTDGTVDIYFPPDKDKIFTKIQNQSVYQDLKPGDGVKILYPNGAESSCWIIGKHLGGKIDQITSLVNKNVIPIGSDDIIEVEILDTLFEQVELTDENPTYTFSPALSLNTNDLYYINYKYYTSNGSLVSNKIYNNFCDYQSNSIIFLTNDIANQLKITSSSVTDTWRGKGNKSVISLYKVKINILDDKKLKAINKEGFSTTTSGIYSHAEGTWTNALGHSAHAEGGSTEASGDYSHAEGYNTFATNYAAHAEGGATTASGERSHAEGNGTKAIGNYSHAEGFSTEASGYISHAEGQQTIASGRYAHTEGYITTASGDYSHTEGYYTTASGNYSHAEGNQTTASNDCAHAEGVTTEASGYFSHAEGSSTIASAYAAHAEGYRTIASSDQAHAGGEDTEASGTNSFAHGLGLIASAMRQFVIGEYNEERSSSSMFIVGDGTSTTRENIFRITSTRVYGPTYSSSGADYAEYFEWFDGNLQNEDRIGRFVTLYEDKIKLASKENDFILGIVSGNPSIIGDAYDDKWWNKYEMDIYGRPIMIEEKIENKDGTTEVRLIKKLNSNFNPELKYTPRSERSEWDVVGMLGKLVLIDDGTCKVNEYCKPSINGVGTYSKEQTKYRVLKRLDKNHVQILIL